jgi:hypothetical protein
VTAIDRDQISFELERFELVGNDRLELTGRWYGVRGRRFVRPSLTVPAHGGSHRSLALLDHKPWSADDGAAWVAAFPWQRDQDDVAEVELAVAPDITVCLPAPTSIGAARRPKRQPGPTAKHSPRRGGERPAAASGPRAGSSRRAEKTPPVKQRTADARRIATERDAARADLTTTQTERDTARAELTTTQTERDTARAHATAAGQRLEIMTKRYQQVEQELRATRAERQQLANELAAALADRDSLLSELRPPAVGLEAARASPWPPPAPARSRPNLPPSDRIELGPSGGSSWAARALAITALLAILVILLLMLR